MIASRQAMAGDNQQELENRLNLFLAVMAISIMLVMGGVGYLQIVRGAHFEALSRGNRIRLVSLTAPRGEMVDRNGELLATPRPAFTASLLYMGDDYTDETLAMLEDILGLERGRIRTVLQRQRGQWYKPIRLKNDITAEEHSRLEEHRHELPGLVIEVVPIREYTGGDLAAHALGRVGFLNTEGQRQSLVSQVSSYDSILLAAGLDHAGYQIDDIIGLIGLERQYDAILRGVDGVREVEVDSRGTPTRVERELPPQAGLQLGLTLDANLQRTLEQAMRNNMERIQQARGPSYATSAAAVVLDVRTGGVLAMASLPSFDPNWSASGRIDPQFLPQLEEFNRAIQGLYTPGSTYKMMTAITAIQEDIAHLNDAVWCGGGYRIGNDYIGCWVGPPGHGRVTLIDAIKVSCNTYFLEMGARLRAKARLDEPTSGMVDMLSKYAADFGLDGTTGIDLPFERAGRSPRTTGRRWLPGEDIQCAIGQSRQEYSPLQLAVYVAALAGNGVRYRPYLVDSIAQDGEVLWQAQPEVVPNEAEISPETYDLVKRGMLAVTSPGGTGYWQFYDLPIKVGAKTGTAQTSKKPNDGLFVGFAPYDNPEIAWAIVVKHGDTGSLAGAPVARELIRTYFGLNQPVATPR